MAKNEREKKERRFGVTRWCIYLLAAFLCGAVMWSAGGRLPLLMIPFAVSVAAFESPVRSAAYACICGLMLDNMTGSLFGFFGISLLWCGLFVSVLFTLLLRRHLLNVFFLNAVASGLLLFLHYFFYINIWGYDPGGEIFLGWYVPMFFLTAIFAIPLYFFVRVCKDRFVLKTEVTLEEKSDDFIRE
jgi:hypothetical protein